MSRGLAAIAGRERVLEVGPTRLSGGTGGGPRVVAPSASEERNSRDLWAEGALGMESRRVGAWWWEAPSVPFRPIRRKTPGREGGTTEGTSLLVSAARGQLNRLPAGYGSGPEIGSGAAPKVGERWWRRQQVDAAPTAAPLEVGDALVATRRRHRKRWFKRRASACLAGQHRR